MRIPFRWSRLLVAGGAVAGAACAGWVGWHWLTYGRPAAPSPEEQDLLLDRFMPRYDVAERQHVLVRAPAATTLEAARQLPLGQLPIVRAIFAAREWLMGSARDPRPAPAGLIDQMQALGWGVLDEEPGREIVMGAVTRPWDANPTFRAITPERFAAFDEPALVKIAWTLRADPIDESSSVFRTETRAVATDRHARDRFRPYWACVSPGIWMIRRASLGPVRREAERRARVAAS